jgi:hypothetical protein
MTTKKRITLVSGMITLSSLISFGEILVFAYPDFSREEKIACIVCHTNPAGGPVLNDVGKKYLQKKGLTEQDKIVDESRIANYIGSSVCKACHLQEYKQWTETPHARAFYLLLGKKSENDPKCLVCHVTGFNLPGGYKIGGGTEDLKNVNCENCHGPGSLHVKASKESAPNGVKKGSINTKVTKEMCLECHTKEQSPEFDFKKYLIHGVHPLKEPYVE